MVELLLSYRNFFRLEKDFSVYLYYVEAVDGPFIMNHISYSSNFHDYSIEFERHAILEHLIDGGFRNFNGPSKILTSDEVCMEYNKIIGLIEDMDNPFSMMHDKDNYSQICSIKTDKIPILNKFKRVMRDNIINNIIQN